MDWLVVFQLLLLLKSSPAQLALERLVPGVGPADVAIVGGVGGEGLPAVLAFEGPLSGVLANVRAQNTGGSKGLKERSYIYEKKLNKIKYCVFMTNGRVKGFTTNLFYAVSSEKKKKKKEWGNETKNEGRIQKETTWFFARP